MLVYMEHIISIYNIFLKDKRKERFDIILEPLQAMLQLAFLAFCPSGTKLSIANNLLQVQLPTWGQALVRTYNHDKKDDVFFLFNAIKRFSQFYGHFVHDELPEARLLYPLLIRLSKKGLDNLLMTYAHVDQPALLHTLHMYRSMLDNPELFRTVNTQTKGKERERERDRDKSQIQNERDKAQAQSHNPPDKDKEVATNIDRVFVNITQLYTPSHIHILYHTLCLMEAEAEHFQTFMDGINVTMIPVNQKIGKWISEHIVY